MADSLTKGGIEKSLAGLVNGLNSEGFNTNVLVYGNIKDSECFFNKPESIYYVKNVNSKLNQSIIKLTGQKGLIKRATLWVLKVVDKTKSFLRTMKYFFVRYDVIVMYSQSVFFAKILPLFHKHFYVVCHHDQRIIYPQLRKTFQKAKHIISPSHGVSDLVESFYKLNKNQGNVIRPLFDLNPAKYSHFPRKEGTQRKVVFITCGRFAPSKGYLLAIDAAKILVSKGFSDFQWFFIGDGTQKQIITESIKENNLARHITIVDGWIPNPQDFFKRGDLYISSSLSEPFGIVMIEAALSGLPIIATQTPGSIDIKDEGIDLTFCESTGESIAQAIIAKINSNKLIASQASIEIAKKLVAKPIHDWKCILEDR